MAQDEYEVAEAPWRNTALPPMLWCIEAHAALAEYFEFYNERRSHSQIGRRPPAHVYRDLLQRKAA